MSGPDSSSLFPSSSSSPDYVATVDTLRRAAAQRAERAHR